MSVRIGSARISGHQRQLLKKAREAQSAQERLSLLSQLLPEPDIESGKESVSPEWLEICPDTLGQVPNKFRNRSLQRFADIARAQVENSPAIDTIDVDESQLVFLLGAGASRPHPTNIPTVNELLPDLLARARRQDRDDLTHLAEFCDSNGINHIEDLLTAAQLSRYCSKHPEVLRLVNFLLYGQRLNGNGSRTPDGGHHGMKTRGPSENGGSVAFLADTLQTLFGLISGRMLPAPPNEAHSAIASYCLDHPNSLVVTTNYDCCIDRALLEQGICSDYRVDFLNGADPELYGTPEVAILKLHGSLNWFYCDTCQDVHLVPIANAVRSFLAPASERIPYPVIGHCDGCNGLRRPLLVPPQALKFDVGPPLSPLIEEATRAFTRAGLIVAVGFSFADSDVHITRSLTRAMKENQELRLLVIDPNLEVSERILRKLSLRIPEFDHTRVLKIVGSCTDSLPALLAGDLHLGAPPRRIASEPAHGPEIPLIR